MSDLMTDGVISLDDRPAVAAVGRANAALDTHEKKTKTVLDRSGREWSIHGDTVVRVKDREISSINRGIAALERQAAVYGKSGIERLTIQREQMIKQLGNEEAAIKRVTAAYDKMIAAESGESKFKRFGEGVANFIERPFDAAKGAAGGLMEAIGPLGGILLGGAAALAAVAGAGFEAAKSLGEYGVQVRDAELRTGLTSKEVGQFGFAARAVGQDISIFERMMRGLTMALEDNSPKGEKARQTLQKLTGGVYELDGSLKPTSEIFSRLSEGLNALPGTFERNKAALDIFKKAGIEAIPVLMALNENVKIAQERGFGSSEEDVKRFEKYQQQIAGVETSWERLKRAVKEPLAATAIFTFKAIGNLIDMVGGGKEPEPMSKQVHASEEADRRAKEQFRYGPERKAAAAGLGSYLKTGLQGAQAELSHLKQKIRRNSFRGRKASRRRRGAARES